MEPKKFLELGDGLYEYCMESDCEMTGEQAWEIVLGFMKELRAELKIERPSEQDLWDHINSSPNDVG